MSELTFRYRGRDLIAPLTALVAALSGEISAIEAEIAALDPSSRALPKAADSLDTPFRKLDRKLKKLLAQRTIMALWLQEAQRTRWRVWVLDVNQIVSVYRDATDPRLLE